MDYTQQAGSQIIKKVHTEAQKPQTISVVDYSDDAITTFYHTTH